MNRTVDIEMGGRTWPMCLTLAAYIKICGKYDGLPECLRNLDHLVATNDNRGLITEYSWLADQLLYAAHAAAEGDDEDTPPNQDDILQLLSPGDMPELQRKVLDCIRIGNSREVGAEAPKNGEGPAEGQAQSD